MKKQTFGILLTGITLVIAFTGCKKAKKATVEPPIRVEVTTAELSSINSSRQYSGTIQESKGADLSFQVPGAITSINVNQGDRVKKGQLIGTVDQTNLLHATQISASALNEAQDVYNRMKKLHDSKSIPDMKWVEAQNALKAAQSAHAIAQKSLSDANLYAPFSGYVSAKFLDAGTTAAPGLPIIKLVVVDPVKVNVSISEDEIVNVNVGQAAIVDMNSMTDKTFSGKIVEKGVVANPVSRTYDVKIEVANPEEELLPGMICNVRLENPAMAEALVLPNNAVLLDAKNQNFVWLVKDGKAEKRVVKVGTMLDNGLAISDGITQGDTIIISGQQKVSNGSALDITNK